MASYVITGASRGLGFEFLRQLSNDPANTVIGIVRDKEATEAKVAAELSRSNVHILQGDLKDYDSLKNAVDDTAKFTGGRLDYVIANAAFISDWSAYDAIGVLGKNPTALEQDLLDSFHVNVIGNIHLFNLLIPLILKGDKKKIITLSTGMADFDLSLKYELDLATSYSISKAAMNFAVAKFHAEYAKDGVLFMSISPGYVATSQYKNATEEQMKNVAGMFEKFKLYAPDFVPMTAEYSIKAMMSVIDKASVEGGYGGSFLSHMGNKQWL
ncbi:MAG: hypothetical protein Q9227_000940 [Pyrenula ochraceoflavens]